MFYHGVSLKCVFWWCWLCNMIFLMIMKLMMFLLIIMMMIWLVIQEHWVFKHIATRSLFFKSPIFRLTLILCNDLDLRWTWLWLHLIEHPQNYIFRYLFCVKRLFYFYFYKITCFVPRILQHDGHHRNRPNFYKKLPPREGHQSFLRSTYIYLSKNHSEI